MGSSAKDDSSTDNGDSNADPSSEPVLFAEGEKVLAYHGPCIYEAKFFAAGRGKKRKVEPGIEEKDTISDDKHVKIPIPPQLKKQLIDDWNFVTQLGKLVKLPRSPCVDDILTKYLDYRSKKDGHIADSIGEILKGLRSYFDKSLPMLLLYNKERQQYHEAIKDDISPSTVYGAEHLLRLFVELTFKKGEGHSRQSLCYAA
ncbi:hypothetical protein Scep_020175 [Stephania cephalantha]|uniref:MRG domain-containing protein n=1 Tax=Stephania cephalantha TaxID=152367 RepID=A0AAP0IC52_9MAGN